jgi:hypothetical protein
MNWELIWKFVLLFTIFGYSLLVIVVFFGGIRNIGQMLRELREPIKESEDESN